MNEIEIYAILVLEKCAKIGYNISKGTRAENNYIIKNMTFADSIKIKRVAPMMLDITLKGANIIQTPTFRDDIERVLGQGVGINNLIVLYPAVNCK